MGDTPRICFSCGRAVDEASGVEDAGRLYCHACSVSRLLGAAKSDEEATAATAPLQTPLAPFPLRQVLLAAVVALLLLQGILLFTGRYDLPPKGTPPREAALTTAPAARALDGALSALWSISREVEAHRAANGRYPDRLDQVTGTLPPDPLGVGYDYSLSLDGRSYRLAIRNAAAYGVRGIGCDDRGIPRVEP